MVEANEDLVERKPARHNFKRGFGPRDETLHSNLDFEAESQVNSTKNKARYTANLVACGWAGAALISKV